MFKTWGFQDRSEIIKIPRILLVLRFKGQPSKTFWNSGRFLFMRWKEKKTKNSLKWTGKRYEHNTRWFLKHLPAGLKVPWNFQERHPELRCSNECKLLACLRVLTSSTSVISACCENVTVFRKLSSSTICIFRARFSFLVLLFILPCDVLQY